MKKYLVSAFILGTLGFGTAAHAVVVKDCQVTITHSSCSMFCESRAETRAKNCALELCELASAESGGSGRCYVTHSNSWNYVLSYDAVRRFVGSAVAREQ